MIIVYMTASTEEEAHRIGMTLVDERIAACVNILGEIKAIYRWKGKVFGDREVAFIAKTADEKFQALEKRVKELHSYECPCIVAYPITAGHQPYLDWLAEQV